jgi:hypothetical protein
MFSEALVVINGSKFKAVNNRAATSPVPSFSGEWRRSSPASIAT